MSATGAMPWVGVVCDVQQVSPHAFHMVGDKYLRALAEAAGVMPVLLPALSDLLEVSRYLDRLDGLFLTGGYSMVHPSLYNEAPVEDQSYDSARDTLSLKLIDAVLDRNRPLFAVCRGFQEVNVALGGRLHQTLHSVPGFQDHREDKTLSLAEQYNPVHDVFLEEGCLLAGIFGLPSVSVNSLHVQGIATLGRGLAIEAKAPDGLIEAFRVEALSFGLAVQWHPEWQVMNNPQQRKLFEAFGDACRA